MEPISIANRERKYLAVAGKYNGKDVIILPKELYNEVLGGGCETREDLSKNPVKIEVIVDTGIVSLLTEDTRVDYFTGPFEH